MDGQQWLEGMYFGWTAMARGYVLWMDSNGQKVCTLGGQQWPEGTYLGWTVMARRYIPWMDSNGQKVCRGAGG